MDAGTPPGERPTNRRWVMFALACGSSWFLYLHRYSWTIIRPMLQEEYDFSHTTLQTLHACFSFSYTAEDPDSGFTEREFAHVFVGVLREQPRPDPAEIDGLRGIRGDDLVRDVVAHPEHYTPWFSELLERLPELEAALSATPE